MSIKDQEEKFKLRFKVLCEAIQKWEMDTFGKCGFVKPEYFGYRSREIRDGGSPMSGASMKPYASARLKEYYLFRFDLDEDTHYWRIEDNGLPEDVEKLIPGTIGTMNYKYKAAIEKIIASTHPS